MPHNAFRQSKDSGPYVVGLSVARGFQVTLMVVLFHTLEGLVRADISLPYGIWDSQILIEPLRMPMFFLVSGVLIHRLLAKSIFHQLRSRVSDLIWPMIIGHYVIIAMQLMASSQTNGGMTALNFPALPLPPYAHLWFMWAMILITGALILIHAVLRQFNCARYTALVALLGALALQGIDVPSYLNGWWLDRVIEDAPYIPLGMLLGRLLTTTVLSRFQVWLCSLLAFAAMIPAVLLDGAFQMLMVMLANVLVLWVICSVCTSKGQSLTARTTRFWAYLGDRSLAIYLYHILWTSGARIGLDVLGGVTAWYVVTPIALILGIVGPLFMLWCIDKASELFDTKRATVRLWVGMPNH